MAGGKGERLKPLTLATPKPMLVVGDKPIIEHNIDRLIQYGIQHVTISVCYLKEQIMDYFGDGSSKGIKIDYVVEDEPLGTIGALSLVPTFSKDHILVMNSDILTNLDFADFFESYQQHNAEMIVATTPYQVNVPFAVMDVTQDNEVKGFAEKPKYTFYSNAGIYILQKKLLPLIPENSFYNATDMMNAVLENGLKLVSGPILGYWLDIGRMDDFKKAQEDIKHVSF
jgi:NDP-sugar pyrophosphorylase family protein